MSDKQINKYKTSLVKNFLWWSIWNKQKMNSVDWQITTRKVMDIMGLLGLAVVLGRAMRGFLFKFEFITI